MPKRTQEEINTSLLNEARDCLGPKDPEANRRIALRLGATPEEADEVALFWQEHNRKWEEAQRKAS